MSTQHTHPNNQVTEAWDGHNVIAVSFDDDRNAYYALTVLKDLSSQGRLAVQEAVIVERAQDGQVTEREGADSMVPTATFGGGLVGLLIGIIGGPIGMLIGGTSGLLAGSLFDLYDVDETESALGAISGSVAVGRTGLLAVVDEPTPEVIDDAMSRLDGTVARQSVADVEAEIAAAEEAQRKATWEARKELVRGRHEHDKAAISAKVDELKAKIHREPTTSAAGPSS